MKGTVECGAKSNNDQDRFDLAGFMIKNRMIRDNMCRAEDLYISSSAEHHLSK